MKPFHIIVITFSIIASFFLGILFRMESEKEAKQEKEIESYIRIIPNDKGFTVEKHGTKIPVYYKNEEISLSKE